MSTDPIIIHGASDDLIEISGVPGYDELNIVPANVWRGDLAAPDGEVMRVYCFYDGVWQVAVGKINENAAFPDWHVEFFDGDRDYIRGVKIFAPEGTVLENYEGFVLRGL